MGWLGFKKKVFDLDFLFLFESTVFSLLSLVSLLIIIMIAKLNISKRTITALTAFSIMLTLLCLFYVTDKSNKLQSSAANNNAIMEQEKNVKANSTLQQQKPMPIKCINNTATKDQIKVTKESWNQCLDAGVTPEYYLSIVIVTRMDDYAGYKYFKGGYNVCSIN